MIKTREQLRAQADADVAEFAELIAADQSETTGIPKPPNIEVTELVLEPEHFDFGIIAEDEVAVEPTDEGGGGGGIPTGGCCAPSGDCSITTEVDCGSFYYAGDGTTCAECGVCCGTHDFITYNCQLGITNNDISCDHYPCGDAVYIWMGAGTNCLDEFGCEVPSPCAGCEDIYLGHLVDCCIPDSDCYFAGCALQVTDTWCSWVGGEAHPPFTGCEGAC